MRRIMITIVGGLLLTVGAAACSAEDVAENAIEKAGGGDVDIETGGDVPDCFPDGAPVPDGSVQGGIGVGEGTAAVCTFIVDVQGGAAAALADYRGELEDDGFTVGFDTSNAGSFAFGVTKGDVGILVGATENAGTTSISITSGSADVGGGAPPG